MDTSIYRYVTAIAECGSISSAAKKLFISQPALTKQLGRVEASLGYKLFDRSRFPIVPTPEGEIFLEYALRYLTMEEEMNRKMNRVQCSDEMYVQVATTHRGGTYVGMHTMPFLKEYPQIQVEYLDNRISLYAAQYGKCAITGKHLLKHEIHCHHKTPKRYGGDDRYENLVIVHSDVHALIHAKTRETIERYMCLVQPTKKQLKKLNKLRTLAKLPEFA